MRVILADDERLARERLVRLLRGDPEVRLVAECADGAETVAALLRDEADLLLLDIQMPRMDGFEVLRALPVDRLPMVIFITAHDQYAIGAFEAQAMDYLLKPFHRQRFQQAMDRAKSQFHMIQAHRQKLTALIQDVRLPVPAGRGIRFISSRDVDWIEGANNYACLHCGVETYVIRETLHRLEERLAGLSFARIHKSVIVNVQRIREIHPLPGGDQRLFLCDGTPLTLSRTYRGRLPLSKSSN